MRKPKMGDWVHYHEKSRHDAPMVTMMALVTEVIANDRVRLAAFHPTEGVRYPHSTYSSSGGAMYSEKPAAERWSWPSE